MTRSGCTPEVSERLRTPACGGSIRPQLQITEQLRPTSLRARHDKFRRYNSQLHNVHSGTLGLNSVQSSTAILIATIYDFYAVVYMLGFENRKHSKLEVNLPISFRDINFVINFNMQISKCSMRIM